MNRPMATVETMKVVDERQRRPLGGVEEELKLNIVYYRYLLTVYVLTDLLAVSEGSRDDASEGGVLVSIQLYTGLLSTLMSAS